MKNDQPYPEQQGVPTQPLLPGNGAGESSPGTGHDARSLAAPVPAVLPDDRAGCLPRGSRLTTSLPPIAGLGKAIQPEEQTELLSDVYKYIKKLEKKVRAGEITEEEARTRLSKRTAEKYAKDLAKDVQKGMTSMDEIAKALGIEKAVAVPPSLSQKSLSLSPRG